MKPVHPAPPVGARTEDVLRLVRGSSDPLPGEEQAVWARIEQRLGMPGAPHALQERAVPRTRGVLQRGVPRQAANLAAQRLPRQLAGSLLPRVALWAVFGVCMAAIGYGMGTRGRAAFAERTGAAAPLAAVPPRTLIATGVAVPPATVALPPPPAVPPPAVPPPAPESVVPVAAGERARTIPPSRARVAPRVQPSVAEPAAPRRVEPTGAEPAAPRVQPSVVEPEPIGLREALELIERARAAVRLGTVGDALELLDELERRNPGTLLEQERLVTRALALCALGDTTRARVIRDRLERLDPQSIYRGQLNASCVEKSTRSGPN